MKFHFKNLDSIRTIAFLSTFFAHAFYSESDEVLNSPIFLGASKFQAAFGFGVPIFFVLSGFLITYLMFREVDLNGKFNIGKFYMRRFLRIWPLYYIVIIFGFVIFPFIRTSVLDLPYIESANPWMYSLFLSNFDQINAGVLPFGAGLGPTWSVSIEEQFYLIWAVLFLIFSKKKFVVIIFLTILISFFLSTFFGLSSKHTVFCMIYLGTGALYAYLAFYHQKLTRKITAVSPFVFLLAVISLAYVVYLISYSSLGFLMVAIAAALVGYIIIYQCYSGKFELRKIPFLERMGKYTYGLYLYHVICNFIIHTIFSKVFTFEDSVTNAVFVKPALSLLLSVFISIFSYKYIESYFLKLKSKFKPVN